MVAQRLIPLSRSIAFPLLLIAAGCSEPIRPLATEPPALASQATGINVSDLAARLGTAMRGEGIALAPLTER